MGAGRERDAALLVRGYLEKGDQWPAGVHFTGSMFDTWDGGGARDGVADTFTDADISAVAFLSVQIPKEAVLEILGRQRWLLNDLLCRIPRSVDLQVANESIVGHGSSASELWEALVAIDGVGPVTAGKLMARKRPRLIPVYDSVVKTVVGSPKSFWSDLRLALMADDAALATRLRAIGALAGAEHLSVLRVFDIVAWRVGKEPPAADPWSESVAG